jgi:hypothetical protein
MDEPLFSIGQSLATCERGSHAASVPPPGENIDSLRPAQSLTAGIAAVSGTKATLAHEYSPVKPVHWSPRSVTGSP